LTEDLKQFDVPKLIIHGDDDQIVPFADSAALSSKLVPGGDLKVYPGAPQDSWSRTATSSTPTCSRSSSADEEGVDLTTPSQTHWFPSDGHVWLARRTLAAVDGANGRAGW
jgi:fermentation-respiration switch protein FrsA (DUF1100 family)